MWKISRRREENVCNEIQTELKTNTNERRTKTNEMLIANWPCKYL